MSKVFKFGGASVKNAAAIQNVTSIIGARNETALLLVVSAMGKVTNALEKVVHAYFSDKEESKNQLAQILEQHKMSLRELELNEGLLDEFFGNVAIFITEDKEKDFDKVYDQIVSLGELASTLVLVEYLQKQGIPATWLDARKIIKTDDTYREGKLDWKSTEGKVQSEVLPLLENQIVVTQGFIGSDQEGNTTTLGREGSDYSASIFAYCLSADLVAIWKDVPGILTGDPKLFENLVKIDRLTYKEAVEMSYYGAKVIHPKTIKPLQNKQIPLYVKSFTNPDADGTLISGEITINYPPVIVVAENQAMLHIATKDFSFVAEDHLSKIFQLFAKHRIKVNVMRNTAISFSVCVQDETERIANFMEELGTEFKIIKDEELELITIRHYHQSVIDELVKGKIVVLEERIRKTIQLVVKDVPTIKRKSN